MRASINGHVFAHRGGLHSLAVQIFAVTVVMMVAALILMSFALSSLKASRVQSEATEDTLLEITSIDTRLVDSDHALYGLVISGDPWFARRLAAIRSETREAMTKLGRSVSDDPGLTGMYATVARRLASRQAIYDFLARPEHHDQVAKISQSAAARAERGMTKELRNRLWDLLRAERTKRFDKHTEMIREAEKSFWIAAGIVLLSVLSGLVSFMLASLPPKSGATDI